MYVINVITLIRLHTCVTRWQQENRPRFQGLYLSTKQKKKHKRIII